MIVESVCFLLWTRVQVFEVACTLYVRHHVVSLHRYQPSRDSRHDRHRMVSWCPHFASSDRVDRIGCDCSMLSCIYIVQHKQQVTPLCGQSRNCVVARKDILLHCYFYFGILLKPLSFANHNFIFWFCLSSQQ